MLRSLFAFAVLTVSTAFAQNPDPKDLIEKARISATLQQTALRGNLSKSGARTPISLYLNNKDIQFVFEQGGATQRFHLRLGDGQYDLFDVGADGKTTRFPAGKLVQPIAGTDVTYEDLSFQFFYWPNPTFEGQENVGDQPCYKLRLNKPKGSGGRYEVVYVWVHAKFGAFMRVRGHNKAGGLIKEFEVEDIMNVGNGVYTLKKMQVATVDPASGRRTGVTNLLFDKPTAEAAKKGLRN